MIDDNDLIPTLPDLSSDGQQIAQFIQKLAGICRSPYTDGFTQCTCKHQLYLLKCLLEDAYKDLPDFPTQEREWEQQRLMELLKK